MGGDFNARTDEKGEMEDGEEERKRRSKDKKVNKEGEVLLGWLEEEGWGIMNGIKEGNKEGEWTLTGGRGKSVIDYVIRDKAAWEKVNILVVEDEVESDHQLVTV